MTEVLAHLLLAESRAWGDFFFFFGGRLDTIESRGNKDFMGENHRKTLYYFHDSKLLGGSIQRATGYYFLDVCQRNYHIL